MASGKQHATVARTALIISIPLGAFAIAFFNSLEVFAAVCSFIFGMACGIYITPDLDVNSGNYSYYKIRNKYGHLAEWLWTIYWRKYAQRHAHRGVSHKPLIGTATRMMYMFWRGGFLLVFLFIIPSIILEDITPILAGLIIILSMYGGMVVQDILHIVWDL